MSNNATVEDNKLDIEDDQCLIDDSIKSLPLPVVLEKEIKIHKGCKSLGLYYLLRSLFAIFVVFDEI